jgi:two-component system NtrC family response regulator
LESELFGHKEGAFTDARFKKQGKWTLANNGTLFLDEIGDLSMSHQGKILRALEDGEITPVGDTEPTSVDARVIAATNKNLHYMVKQGTFREDLMFRLRTFLIPVPALYLHQEDIPPIANHLWQKITDDPQAVLPDPVLAEIQKRRWPGNAREIKSALECVHAIVGADGIDPDILRAVLDQQDGPERDLFG